MKYFKMTAFLAGMLLAVSCGQNQQGMAGNGPQEFKVLTIAPKDAVLNLDYPSVIEGEEDIEIMPKIDGYIQKILVDEGQIVKKGQLLFIINAPQYEQEMHIATAAIKSAEADVSTAKIQVNRVTPLVKKEIISGFELEQVQLLLQAKESVLAQARAHYHNAKTNISYTTISSPVDGIVGKLPHKIGSLVSPTMPQSLTTISNNGNFYAYFSFDEKQFIEFNKSQGSSLKERLATFPSVLLVLPNGANYDKPGKIETIGGMIDSKTGAVSLRATFPNPTGNIRSGSSAIVRIPKYIKSAILVPQQSTYELQGKVMVYVVDAKGMVKSRELSVLDNTSGTDYVVASGLKAGEKIIAEGMGNLRDSIVIKPI